MSALAKAKERTAALQKSTAQRMRKIKAENEKTVAMAAGHVGGAASAVGCALIDATFANPGETAATFGDSSIPIAPVVGGAFVAASFFLGKYPSTQTFIGQGGSTAIDIWLYNTARQKFDEKG